MCKKCKASKIGKMKRRKRSRVRGIGIDTKSIVPTLTAAGLSAVGFIAANKIGGLKFLEDKNPYMKAGIKVAGGLALSMIKGNAFSLPLGIGLESNGILQA